MTKGIFEIGTHCELSPMGTEHCYLSTTVLKVRLLLSL